MIETGLAVRPLPATSRGADQPTGRASTDSRATGIAKAATSERVGSAPPTRGPGWPSTIPPRACTPVAGEATSPLANLITLEALSAGAEGTARSLAHANAQAGSAPDGMDTGLRGEFTATVAPGASRAARAAALPSVAVSVSLWTAVRPRLVRV